MTICHGRIFILAEGCLTGRVKSDGDSVKPLPRSIEIEPVILCYNDSKDPSEVMPMTIQQILTLLSIKGLLHEDESLTIAGGEEAASISLTLPHLLILKNVTAEGRAILSSRLSMLYEKESALILLSSEGHIHRLTIDEFQHDQGKEPFLFLFDSRKARGKEPTPFTLSPLEKTMDVLLAPGGCPWDRAQDHTSLRTYFLQEVYEVIDAIDKGDMVNLKEELGDVLLQIVFHARLAEKEGFFTMQDVVDGINEKMIRRHPFVFEKITVEETKKLLGDWETRKRLEKNRKYLLSGVSKDLPSLLLACIIQRKVGSHGLTEALEGGALPASCVEEIKAAVDGKGAVDKELSAGRFLFALDRVINAEGVEPELALHRYARYVMDQLRAFEKGLFQRGKSLMDISPEEAQVLWQDFCRKTDTSALP